MEAEMCCRLATVCGKRRAFLMYLGVVKFLPFRSDKVKDAVSGAREGHSSDQKDDQHHVGKRGCEINHLTKEGTR